MTKNAFVKAFRVPLILVFIMWAIAVFQFFMPDYFLEMGLLPRSVNRLSGIITSPFIHGDFSHLISNTIPFFFLLWAIFYFHRKYAFIILILTWLITNGLVWVFARNSYHIGASGLVYAYFGFLVVSGFILRNIKQLAVSFIVIVLYGGMLWGIFPTQRGVSWESHLFGVISGVLVAYLYKIKWFKPPKKKKVQDTEYTTDFWNEVIEKD